MSLSKGTIGEKIANARKATGLTQAELSEKIGIAEKYLSRIGTPFTSGKAEEKRAFVSLDAIDFFYGYPRVQ